MTEIAIMSLGLCPNCHAGWPDYHSPVGSPETMCDNCGWASDEEVPFDQRLVTRGRFLVLQAILHGAPSFLAVEAVASTAIEHPEWDMSEVRRICDWQRDLE